MIAILLPTLGDLKAPLHDWLTITAASVPIVEYKAYGVSPLEKAFNLLHRRFLASDCEYAFVINDDEVPPRGALERLLDHDKDMVSCVAPKWDEAKGPLPVASVRRDDKFVYINGPGLMRADRCGFSGILIKRAVMEAVPVGTFEYLPTAECSCGWIDHLGRGITECPQCHSVIPQDHTYFISPEFRFLDVARELGFELWVDFDLELHHLVDGVDLKAVNRLIVEAERKTRSRIAELVRALRGDGVEDAEIVEALLAQE